MRTSAWAQTAPNRLVLAPMTAAGLAPRTLWGNGLETQSRPFLSCPGIEFEQVAGGFEQLVWALVE